MVPIDLPIYCVFEMNIEDYGPEKLNCKNSQIFIQFADRSKEHF